MPVTAPRALGFPYLIHSTDIQVNAPAAAEIWVTAIAMAALPPAVNALPPLNPNQPTHSIPAPAMVNVMLCGGMGCVGKPCRALSTNAVTTAAVPAVMCTTLPPAKSRNPRSNSQPVSAQTQCVIGAYTIIDQSAVNSRTETKRIRSAKPPTISAGVMIAKVSWKIAKLDSGIVPQTASSPTPAKRPLESPPMKELPTSKARL